MSNENKDDGNNTLTSSLTHGSSSDYDDDDDEEGADSWSVHTLHSAAGRVDDRLPSTSGVALLILGLLVLLAVFSITAYVAHVRVRGKYSCLADAACALYFPLVDGRLDLEDGVPVRDVIAPRKHAAAIAHIRDAELRDRASTQLSLMEEMTSFTRLSTIIPLEYVPSDAVYYVYITVGGSLVRAAFDSGSSALVVGTRECIEARAGCNAAHGAYEPASTAIPASKDVMVMYGSQTVQSDVQVDTLRLNGFQMDGETCSRLQGGAFSRVLSTAEAAAFREDPHAFGIPITSLTSVPVYAARVIRGSSSANVFGTAPDTTGTSMIDAVLDAAQLHSSSSSSSEQLEREWGVLLTATGGLWVLGRPPTSCGLIARALTKQVPYAPTAAAEDIGTRFYMTPIYDVLCGASLREMRSILAHVADVPALHLMVDTGCTVTYTSEVLRGPLRAAGVHGRPSDAFTALRLTGGTFLVLDPAVYGPEGGLDTGTSVVNLLLHAEGVVLGALALRGIYCHFNLDARTIAFTQTLYN